ncbi:phenylacrylic acid decarboxylase-like protein [Trichoderma reesei QM6a]|uniref:Phenylacrylic acid decarboxylase-like protein n=2 Tax=Hypocrea jecorina TaxID=51453 RepID=G0RVE3_HYPJQ|nr:phenylacrylic acid decarboxylase-like protein [Trichoderma reesei QM6a]EGR44793.1 phenylacrylic acid decarboxylase-like protein [Trichoderma reesei QM6a]ETR97716.1 Phenylacrylic acid decarboxylase [Trichoderma reesei RUT C-30]
MAPPRPAPKNAIKPPPHRKRIIVAMTGASGAILGVRVLMALRHLNVETHLIMSKWARHTIDSEVIGWDSTKLHNYAQHVYDIDDMEARIASGSFRVDGMIVVPCSMKTLAAIYNGLCDNVITRAADVCLKERRRLVLVTRETPLSEIHLRNMLGVTRAGAVVFPPCAGVLHRGDFGGRSGE